MLFLLRRGASGDELLHGGAKPVPARQGQTALAPAKAPGNSPQVFNPLRCLARCGARADVQLRNLADGRGAEKVFGETGGLVHQCAVGGHAVLRQLGSDFQERVGGGLGGLQQGSF